MINTTSVGTTGSGKRPSRLFGHFLIKERFQYKFALLVGGFLAVATFSIWYFGQLAVTQLVANETIKDQIAIEQLQNLNGLVFKISLIFMAAALFVSLLFSHLVAGPIYRFEKTFEEIREGNLTLFIKLRKHDEFKDTAELFNQAISSLRKKVQKERDVVNGTVDKIAKLALDLRTHGRADDAAAIEAIIAELRSFPPQIKI